MLQGQERPSADAVAPVRCSKTMCRITRRLSAAFAMALLAGGLLMAATGCEEQIDRAESASISSAVKDLNRQASAVDYDFRFRGP